MRRPTAREKEIYEKASGGTVPFALIQPWSWWIGSWRGLTLGCMILIRYPDKLDVTVHELVHVRQFYRAFGFFWLKYLYYQVRYGYAKNPYEVAAYAVQAKAKALMEKVLS